MLTSAILLFAWAVQSAPAADWPPEPDFITPVDYAAWFEKRVRRGEPQSQNAAPFYREILGEPIPVTEAIERKTIENWKYGGGPGWNGDGKYPRIWSVDERPDWKAAYEARRPMIERYKLEAAKAYFDFGSADYGRTGPPELKNWADEMSWKVRLISWANCVRDQAWHATGGTINANEFSALLKANLGLARQLERCDRFVSSLHAIRTRWFVYEDMRELIDQDLINSAERRRILAMVKHFDAPLRPLADECSGELAVGYAALQTAAWGDAVQWIPFRQNGRLPDVESKKRAALVAARDELREFYGSCAALDTAQWSATLGDQVAALAQKSKRAGSEGDIEGTARATIGGIKLRFRTIAIRRATWLVYHIFEFHDLNGRYPGDLRELTSVPAETKTDPFGGEPFVYSRTNDSFRLYSAGLNCRDDGGRHDNWWGERRVDADYVIWPVQR
ncbi:MAG: hypothetical protein IT450_21010 [Phycisphaerales bacterium]|nr:hypothetical protein [Phycisphaerales bacterium]